MKNQHCKVHQNLMEYVLMDEGVPKRFVCVKCENVDKNQIMQAQKFYQHFDKQRLNAIEKCRRNIQIMGQIKQLFSHEKQIQNEQQIIRLPPCDHGNCKPLRNQQKISILDVLISNFPFINSSKAIQNYIKNQENLGKCSKKQILINTFKNFNQINSKKWEQNRIFLMVKEQIYSILFADNCMFLGGEKIVQVWKLGCTSFNKFLSLNKHQGNVIGMNFIVDHLVTFSNDDTVVIWQKSNQIWIQKQMLQKYRLAIPSQFIGTDLFLIKNDQNLEVASLNFDKVQIIGEFIFFKEIDTAAINQESDILIVTLQNSLKIFSKSKEWKIYQEVALCSYVLKITFINYSAFVILNENICFKFYELNTDIQKYQVSYLVHLQNNLEKISPGININFQYINEKNLLIACSDSIIRYLNINQQGRYEVTKIIELKDSPLCYSENKRILSWNPLTSNIIIIN